MNTHLKNAMRRATVVLGALFLASGCATDATGPARENMAAPQASVLQALGNPVNYISATVLGRVAELPGDITVSKKIGVSGGRIVVAATGFELIIPRGALSNEVVISVTAIAGKSVAYEFAPHGITFRRPLQFRQLASFTEGVWSSYGGGYFQSRSQIESEMGTASLNEMVSASLNLQGWITFDIWHFSGYLVSCA